MLGRQAFVPRPYYNSTSRAAPFWPQAQPYLLVRAPLELFPSVGPCRLLVSLIFYRRWSSLCLTSFARSRATRCGPRIKARGKPGPLAVFVGDGDSVVHAAHAAARHSRHATFFLRPFSDHGFRGDQQPRDGCCIL